MQQDIEGMAADCRHAFFFIYMDWVDEMDKRENLIFEISSVFVRR
jgi:hypothetical protein